MATTILTGRNLTLTIATKTYASQATSVTMKLDNRQETYETLGARIYKTIDYSGTLSIEMLADWGQSTSLCQALWDAAKTSPDTTLAFTFVAGTGATIKTYTGYVYPAFPEVGGSGADALTAKVDLVIDQGVVTAA